MKKQTPVIPIAEKQSIQDMQIAIPALSDSAFYLIVLGELLKKEIKNGTIEDYLGLKKIPVLRAS